MPRPPVGGLVGIARLGEGTMSAMPFLGCGGSIHGRSHERVVEPHVVVDLQ